MFNIFPIFISEMGYWNKKADIWNSWKFIKICIYCKSGKWQIIFTGGDLPQHSFKQFHVDTSLRNRHLQNEVSSVCFSLSASIPAVLAKAGKTQTCWLSAILYWHKESFFFLSRRQKFKQSRICSSLFGVHCKCVWLERDKLFKSPFAGNVFSSVQRTTCHWK